MRRLLTATCARRRLAVSELTSWTASPTQPPLHPFRLLSSSWSRVFITRKSNSIFHWLLLPSLCILSGYPGIWSLTTIWSIVLDECHFPQQLWATQEDVKRACGAEIRNLTATLKMIYNWKQLADQQDMYRIQNWIYRNNVNSEHLQVHYNWANLICRWGPCEPAERSRISFWCRPWVEDVLSTVFIHP